MDLAEKLEILADSAKYDVACTSSGVGRPGRHGSLGSCAPAGICHAFAPELQFRACPAVEVRINALIFAQPLPHGCGIRLRAVAGNEHAPLFAVLDNRARCAAVGEQFRLLPRSSLVGENTSLDGVPRFRRERDFP